ncbi:AAA family ATPase [Streptomyces sp. MAD19A]|uniref:AAA family ATPase n=1 Tax=Streptomyces sp. MAD19A TaxID=3242896 RepID=UPI0035288097
MHYRKLIIENFGPYKGKHVIDFPRDKGVYIISAPNGIGKSKLQAAFRWALYGKLIGRLGSVNPAEMANSEAKRENGGVGRFSTTLEFHYSGRVYRMTRRYDEGSDPIMTVLMERDGIALNQMETEKTRQEVAPESVSQFFLFDSELLRDYELLLADNNDQGAKLEEAIERVLGIPLVANAVADAEEARARASKKVAVLAAADRNTKEIGSALEEANDVRAQLIRDRLEVGRLQQKTDQRIREIEQALTAQPRAERLMADLQRLRGQRADLEEAEEAARQSLAALSDELWMAVLAEPAQALSSRIQAEVEEVLRQMRVASAAIRDREHLTHHTDCPVCERQLNEGEREAIISRAHLAIDAHEELEARWARLRGHSEVLRAIAAYDGRVVHERDQTIRRLRLEINNADDEISEIEDQLRGVNQSEFRALMQERDERVIEAARHKKGYDSIGDRIQKQNTVISDLNKNLARFNFKANPAVELTLQVSDDLVKLFQQSIATYRTQLRERIESLASEIFSSLAADPDYVGLKITDRYGLQIIDADGRIVTGRSSGYETLVALSLIAALQRSAAVRGTVVMDSPFMRLDGLHTDNVISVLPRMADQIILLMFDTEYDPVAARRSLGTNLIAEYELVRVGHRSTRIKLSEEN